MYQRDNGANGVCVKGLLSFLINYYTFMSFLFFLINVYHRYAKIKFKLHYKLRKSNRKLKSPENKFVKIAPLGLKNLSCLHKI